MSVYEYSATAMSGEEKSLKEYAGQVLLIVNTATKCGFTPQLKDLQALQEQYQNQGFTVLGFPCNQFGNQEPGPNNEVEKVCQFDYGVQFPLFQKIDVKGENAHPLFQYLTSEQKGFLTEAIKWNFTKFLVDRNGEVIARYAPTTKPENLKVDIEEAL